MIQFTTSPAAPIRPAILSSPAKPVAAQVSPQVDRLSVSQTSFLRAEVLREPEVRAEVVARARALAADPSYPPFAVLQDIASQIVRSPDLSEDVS